MNTQDEIKYLKQRIAELEELEKVEHVFPREGDTFWFLNTYGVVMGRTFKKDTADIKILEIGHVFKTRQEAEFAVKKLKVEAELRKYNRPFKQKEYNYFINLDNRMEISLMATNTFNAQGVLYFESEESAYEAINKVGEERIKKYIFEVEE